MPRAKTVNHELESLSYVGSKLWNSISSHMKERNSINEFKHVSKKKNIYIYTKIDICLAKSECHNRFFPFFPLHYIFTFPCLVFCWNLLNLFEI